MRAGVTETDKEIENKTLDYCCVNATITYITLLVTSFSLNTKERSDDQKACY